MLAIKKIPLYRLFFFLSKKRKIQFYFLIFLQIINGFFESFSIAAIVPFISIIALNNSVSSIPIIGNIFTFFGIYDNSKTLFLITIFFCAFIIISTFFRLFNLRYIHKLTANLEIELSRKIFKDNILQSYISYAQKNSAEVITITIEKVSATATALSSLLILTGSAILGIFIVGSLVIINWQIVFVSVSFLIVYYLIIYKKVSKTLYRNGKLIASISPKRLRLIQEVFQGFRDIVVNGTQKIYIHIFPRYLIEGLVVLTLIILGYNFSLLNVKIVSLIPVFGSAIYALQKLIPLIQLIYATWADYRARSTSILDVVNELEFNKKNKQNIKLKDNLIFKKSIEFKNIYFSYETSKDVLKNINFKIKKGEHIGIFGETGSGKSTLLDMIIGLLPPTRGEIFVDDISLYKSSSNFDWTKNIASVSQNIFLKEGTIAENIAHGESPYEFDFELLKKASKIAQIYEFIKQTEMGFETQVGERGIRLSGGQRQRISIARAIYKSREILVLDEATSALDDKTEELIIESLKRDKNLTIIMVTHRLKSLRICDRVFKVEKRKLFEEKNY